MFVGFPSTQSPAVQWWDYSKTNSGTNNTNITLANDCAPVQYFATGGSATTIQVTLPPSPPQGKTIIIKNDKYGGSVQAVQINDGSVPYISAAVLGVASEVTYCYIAQNTLAGTGSSYSNWVRIGGGSTHLNQFGTSIGGYTNHASGFTSATLGGSNSTASGFGATAIGGSSNTASATYACVFGALSTANSIGSFVVGSNSQTSRSIAGNVVFAANDGPYSGGSKQLGLLSVGAQTTDATATILRSNTSAASTTNQVILPNNSAYYFNGSIVAGVTGAGNTAAWSFEGVIKRGANAAATSIVQSVVNIVGQDSGASTWVVALTADVTNGGLAVTVTGAAATTIRWLCQIRTTEMGF